MSLPTIFTKYHAQIEKMLDEYLSELQGPKGIIDAMRYSVMAGGKRLRPVLVLGAYDLIGRTGLNPMPYACAVEFIHTYSLIHDDLPCMDNDDMRRGKPTCHKMFGEAVALLAGDALLTEAFSIVAKYYKDKTVVGDLVLTLSIGAGTSGMVGGQYIDTIETGKQINRERLEAMHKMKTGALIKSSVIGGGIIGGATDYELTSLSIYGEKLGLSFQVIDDYLDAVGSTEDMGKRTGKDKDMGKNTYVKEMGEEGALIYAMKLCQDAKDAIGGFGSKSKDLVEIADFVVSRTF